MRIPYIVTRRAVPMFWLGYLVAWGVLIAWIWS